jgi:secreted Zn-dependent insulinase-like peptidase
MIYTIRLQFYNIFLYDVTNISKKILLILHCKPDCYDLFKKNKIKLRQYLIYLRNEIPKSLNQILKNTNLLTSIFTHLFTGNITSMNILNKIIVIQ